MFLYERPQRGSVHFGHPNLYKQIKMDDWAQSRTYIDKVLDRFNMKNSKNGFLPMSHCMSLSEKQCPLTPNELEDMSRIPYASTIGSIMYAMICTQLDIPCALSVVSKQQSCQFLVFGGVFELCVKGYTNASFLTNKVVSDHNLFTSLI